ncbi:hypothetical protein EWM64_g9182 [Hericium alpestre]|uniref:Tyrosinase copper-binding domain-containing protein n=1 Tax=Hericium alpestre TaxID=135208 RepID=A0A4Y9ZLY3_9AGAM|nr:hypothetical protein EWM64_g9182 [Hericium alpestre]
MTLAYKIHFTGLFLPWHRWFVQAYETALKDQCGYTGASPYWNWTQDPDPASGLGGWGDPARDFAVPDGGFSNLHLSYPVPHTLRRNFTLQPFLALDTPAIAPFVPDPAMLANSTFTASEVEKMVGGFVGDFVGFQQYFEQYEGAHSSVHVIMGGDLGGTCPINAPQNCTPGPTWSVNEPLFFMHHAMVDKVWSDWQQRNVTNFGQFHGGTVQELTNFTLYTQYPNGAPPFLNNDSKIPADGMFPEVSIADVMNTTGGYLCYVYE